MVGSLEYKEDEEDASGSHSASATSSSSARGSHSASAASSNGARGSHSASAASSSAETAIPGGDWDLGTDPNWNMDGEALWNDLFHHKKGKGKGVASTWHAALFESPDEENLEEEGDEGVEEEAGKGEEEGKDKDTSQEKSNRKIRGP